MSSKRHGVIQNMNSMTSSFSVMFSIRALLISYRIIFQNIQSIFNNHAIRHSCQIHLHSSRTGCMWNHPSDCEVNCEVDPAYWIRKEQKGGKPISAFPQLNPTVACYCLLLQPLTLPSQNPVSARDQPTSRLIGITFAPCFNPSR